LNLNFIFLTHRRRKPTVIILNDTLIFSLSTVSLVHLLNVWRRFVFFVLFRNIASKSLRFKNILFDLIFLINWENVWIVITSIFLVRIVQIVHNLEFGWFLVHISYSAQFMQSLGGVINIFFSLNIMIIIFVLNTENLRWAADTITAN
jgi:hypothetical protein